jgi:lysozyme family protein
LRVNFKDCLTETLKWEGGYSNHPSDPGGKTNFGVIQRVYNSYLRLQGKAPRDVRKITGAEVEDIYKTLYWDKIHGDKLPIGLDLAVFDFCVNSGPNQATKELQRTLNKLQDRKLTVDGNFGPATLDAATQLHDLSETIRVYMDRRAGFFKSLKKLFPVFGKGWMRRLAGIKATSLKMADDGLQIPVARPEVPKDLQTTPKVSEKTIWTSLSGYLGGAGTAILSAISNPYAMAIAALVVLVGAIFLWRYLKNVRLGT